MTLRPYTLVFYGSFEVPYFPRYRRLHKSMESAEEAAAKVRERLDEIGVTAAHPALVFGPGCGKDGQRLW